MGVDRFETPATPGGVRIAITDALGVIFAASDPALEPSAILLIH